MSPKLKTMPQLTLEQRYEISHLKKQGCNNKFVAEQVLSLEKQLFENPPSEQVQFFRTEEREADKSDAGEQWIQVQFSKKSENGNT